MSERIDLPVRQITGCTFGAAEASTHYITTSGLSLGERAEPETGAMSAAETALRGAVQHGFAG